MTIDQFEALLTGIEASDAAVLDVLRLCWVLGVVVAIWIVVVVFHDR